MESVALKVWGCRGGRNACGSRIGNSTSCYSVAAGGDLFVLDAGRGLVSLSAAWGTDPGLRAVGRAHLLVTHAHLDHWEGLKDAEWLWRRDNGLDVTLLGPREALDAIRRGHEPPSFVPLEVLARGTLARLSFVELTAGCTLDLPGATLQAVALHHYSGVAPNRRYLDTLGYRLALAGGPTVAYLSDHEPTPATGAMEDAVLASCDLAIVDGTYANADEHAFGHGSIEHAARLARRHPRARVLAAHHGPTSSDDQIEAAHHRHGAGCDNLAIAVEGADERWDPAARRFTRA